MHPDIILAIIGCIILFFAPAIYWHYSLKDQSDKRYTFWLYTVVIIGDILILYVALKTYGGF